MPGLSRPDISILSDEFLAEVRGDSRTGDLAPWNCSTKLLSDEITEPGPRG